jgi:NADH dehydrogenase (ubiquinone) 1 beta subcomplex subunit 7
MKVTEAEMKAARIDVSFRDYCAHLLIPLNTCRRANFYMPFKCGEERHAYEKCQYHE